MELLYRKLAPYSNRKAGLLLISFTFFYFILLLYYYFPTFTVPFLLFASPLLLGYDEIEFENWQSGQMFFSLIMLDYKGSVGGREMAGRKGREKFK